MPLLRLKNLSKLHIYTFLKTSTIQVIFFGTTTEQKKFTFKLNYTKKTCI